MDAATMLYFIGACVALMLYGGLLVVLVCWFADRLPTQLREDRPLKYGVTLLDRLRRYKFVRFGHKKFALYSADHAARRFLSRLSRRRLVQLDDSDRWLRLIAYLDDFRRLHRDRPIAGLLWCSLYGDVEMQRIAVWLLGKSGNRAVIPALLRLAPHPQQSIRKEVARSLRRLNAWAELRAISGREADPEVLRFTVQPPPKSFPSRLAQFLGRPDHSAR